MLSLLGGLTATGGSCDGVFPFQEGAVLSSEKCSEGGSITALELSCETSVF